SITLPRTNPPMTDMLFLLTEKPPKELGKPVFVGLGLLNRRSRFRSRLADNTSRCVTSMLKRRFKREGIATYLLRLVSAVDHFAGQFELPQIFVIIFIDVVDERAQPNTSPPSLPITDEQR